EFVRELSSEQLLGDARHLAEPQQESFLPLRKPPIGIEPLAAQLWIERVGDVVDIARRQPGMFQAPADGTLGKLMRIVEMRFLGVLDAVEAFLLDGTDELAVDEQRRRGLMIHRVDTENVHRASATLLRAVGRLANSIGSVSGLTPLQRRRCGISPRPLFYSAGSRAWSYSALKRPISSAAGRILPTLPTPCPAPQISFQAFGLARSPEESVPKLILDASEVGRLSGSMPAATID